MSFELTSTVFIVTIYDSYEVVGRFMFEGIEEIEPDDCGLISECSYSTLTQVTHIGSCPFVITHNSYLEKNTGFRKSFSKPTLALPQPYARRSTSKVWDHHCTGHYRYQQLI